MEYDNDKPRKRAPRLEIFYWIMLALLQPLTSGILGLSTAPAGWLLLLLTSSLVFPAYLIYSRIVGPALGARERRRFAWLMSILSFGVIQAFLWMVYALFGRFSLKPPEHTYFSLTILHLIREGWWTVVNMALSIAIFYIRKADDGKDQLAEMKKDNTFFQLRYLRAQLNPHFLFNTLNSIYSLSLQKSERTPEVVIRLADIMRYLIYECNEDKIPLDKEIEFIRNYIEIEKIRHSADIRFTVEGETAGLMIEPFLFISFIENGFKHAMDHTFNDPFIFITLRVGNGQLTLNVLNSTNADLELQAKKLNGMGISHSRTLLELLYPAAYDLDIIQTEKDETRTSALRLRNARERLESLYPDAHTLDVILNKKYLYRIFNRQNHCRLLKCIIVEDEILAQDVIRSHLARIGQLELLGVYRTAPEAQAALRDLDVDVLFLDIRLPGMSGLHFLRGLADPPLVVLTTAYAEYALEGYEFNVIDYLLKPISFERFSKAVNKILDGRLYSLSGTPADARDDDHIFIKSNSKFFRVDFAEILYVQGMKDYLKLFTPDFTLITHHTMNEMEKTLPSRQFLRVHRSYIVATKHIRAIYGNSIELGKVTIPIGVNYKDTVMELIGRR